MYQIEEINTHVPFNSRRSTLKIFNRLLALLILIIATPYCLAAAYIDALTVRKDNWNTIAYAKVVWPNEDNQNIICHHASGCLLKPCMLDDLLAGCQSDMDRNSVQMSYGATLKEARDIWVKKYGIISKELRFKFADISLCVTLGVSDTRDINMKALPQVTCLNLPPVNVSCTITQQLDISYNTLVSDKVNNAEAYGNINILCDNWVNVRLLLAGPKVIDLGRAGRLTASLHTQGKNLADGYEFRGFGQTATLKITSVLHSGLQDAEPGSFAGQGVIVMQLF
ncbi:hypothetical protein JTY93_17275 [Pseudomonas hygromyciniae]|uniref:Fimbrial adhesin MrpH C-terminal domain-containing protein n=1 Tax=Pseudomonas hygromyciniae TaxID=2812000 RepID=A0ABX7JV45_9PSED|nr:hypothetical protein [Pseudomonas hygromyciniae]MBN0977201.1 hypothetical protein [Pseudomonas hygromyciniae]QSB38043.1 hypothetical protein JTY93_17275 [Pseudomonas hygromyciniae]